MIAVLKVRNLVIMPKFVLEVYDAKLFNINGNIMFEFNATKSSSHYVLTFKFC